jgi:GNAT superfamily N-acetyltransferase
MTEIAAWIHPDLPERPEVFAEKMRLFPEGCLVLCTGEAIVGYGIAHPWKLRRIPPLDGFLESLPSDADCFYVHDVAVLPAFRGGRTAEPYIQTIETLATSAGIGFLTLVSVYGTASLWERFGFRMVTADVALRTKLHSYGETAKYMIRDLGNC